MSAVDPRRQAGFTLRAATLADAEAIAHVHEASRAAAFREQLPPDVLHSMPLEERIARWHQWLVAAGTVTLVAERDGVIVGFCTLAPSPDEDADPRRVADMPTLYVHPEHWRQGIGRALCDAVIDLARTREYVRLTLWTLETNSAARGFYESLGFRADGARKTDPGVPASGIMGLRFRLELEGAAEGA